MTSKKPKLVATPWSAERPSGLVLTGDLYSLASPPTSRHVIVFAHGVLSNKDHNFTPDLTEALVAATGHTVLRFDFRFAPSELEPSFRYRFCGFEDDLDDLLVVLRKLRADRYLPYALVGHSRGANDVLMLPGRPEAAGVLYGVGADTSASAAGDAAAAGVAAAGAAASDAAATPPLPWPLAVVALSARYYMPAMFTRLFADDIRAAVEATGSAVWPSKRGDLLVTADDAAVVRERMDMAADVSAMPPRVPVLLFHGTEDEIIPVDDARAFKDLRPSIDLHVVEGASPRADVGGRCHGTGEGAAAARQARSIPLLFRPPLPLQAPGMRSWASQRCGTCLRRRLHSL